MRQSNGGEQAKMTQAESVIQATISMFDEEIERALEEQRFWEEKVSTARYMKRLYETKVQGMKNDREGI